MTTRKLGGAVGVSEDVELERITNQDIENIRVMSKNIKFSDMKKIRNSLHYWFKAFYRDLDI